MSRLFSGAGAASRAKGWAKGLGASRRVMLVSEPEAHRRFGSGVARALRGAGLETATHLLPRGEGAKKWGAVEGLLGAMLDANLGRDAGLVALGGGAVTDAAGFAAAVYLRGIPWVSVPTTLLGQLDSGLGGKTGINLPQGKNLAGAFHQPVSVVCDTAFLASLPERERVSGLAEALKYGLVFEPGLWSYIRKNWASLRRGDPAATAFVVRRGAAWKLKVVAKDEREKGPRELLNFGHTLGHALEAAAGLGRLRHGEAVIWGMRAALRLSVSHAGLPQAEFIDADAFLAAIPLPLPRVDLRRLMTAARRDKKAREGRLRFVLLRRLGRPVVLPVEEEAVASVAKELL